MHSSFLHTMEIKNPKNRSEYKYRHP